MLGLAAAGILWAACDFNGSTRNFGQDGGLRNTLVDATSDDAFINPLAPDADPGAPDADPNAPDATPLVCTNWAPTPAHFNPCLIQAPVTGLTLTAGLWIYNTTTRTLTTPAAGTFSPPSELISQAGGDAVLLSVDDFSVQSSATLRVIGSRPLIVASWGTIEVDGTIDVSSKLGSQGAGANLASCSSATDGASSTDGGGGGGGGGFQGTGGNGGSGDSSPGVGGGSISPPADVVGGCPGAKGGDGDAPGGPGGASGGSIQLSALTSIAVNGTILAGGEGGRGGQSTDGGAGGGGSGGYIGLDAPSIATIPMTVLVANGGGGGGGADDNGNDGAPGQEARADDTKAGGGAGGNSGGGDGGKGSGEGQLSGENFATPGAGEGGGGGGGSAGYILIYTDASPMIDGATIVSPAEVVL